MAGLYSWHPVVKLYGELFRTAFEKSNMEDESTIESRASNSPVTPSMSNPGTPRSDVASEVHATPPPQPGQQQHRQHHQLQQQQQQLLQQQMQQQLLQQQQSQSKYSQLLAVIEDMGRDIRPTYSGSRTSAERLKRGIVHARILVRECLMECERSARS